MRSCDLTERASDARTPSYAVALASAAGAIAQVAFLIEDVLDEDSTLTQGCPAIPHATSSAVSSSVIASDQVS